MKSDRMTLNKVRGLVEKCVHEGVSLVFYDPETATQPPLSEELQDATMMGYATALHDVLEAIDGNPGALEAASSEPGRLAIRPEDLYCFQEEMKKQGDEAP